MLYPHELLETRLYAACSASADSPNLCLEAVNHHLRAGGGRVRARICLDAGVRLGLREPDAFLAAVVCELLHNASLIQDDLLDRTPMRRNEKSVWAKYGDTIAVCAGDLMLSAAFGQAAELSSPGSLAPMLRLVHRRTAEVILGQAAEHAGRDEPLETLARYELLTIGKSASLLSLSLELPLLLSGNASCLPDAHALASDFAVAYQIVDDLDDVAQDGVAGSMNLPLILVERDGLTQAEARETAARVAAQRLESAAERAKLLPANCAATLLDHADKLRRALARCLPASVARAAQ